MIRIDFTFAPALVLLTALAAFTAAAPRTAFAQAKNVFDLTSAPQHQINLANETDLPLRLKPGKYQVVPINAEFGSATVDDGAAKLTIVPYSKNSVAFYPHGEGAAHAVIYGKDGKVIMARYVVIADPSKQYIRLRENCKKPGDANCGRTLVYYCPNFCYETRVINPPPALVQK